LGGGETMVKVEKIAVAGFKTGHGTLQEFDLSIERVYLVKLGGGETMVT